MSETARTGTWAEALLTFVQLYPGVHLREIRRRLRIPIGTLDYHLYRLGRQGLVAIRFQGGYKCCYPSVSEIAKGPIPAGQQVLLAFLRQPLPRALLLHLYIEGSSTPSQLGVALDTTGPNLSYYLKRLEAAQLLVREGQGSARQVRLLDAKQVHQVLLEYPPLAETTVDRFLRFWSELHP
ncbi:MAG TPA: MarR family transcriptional regulator [Thermoplasmata archaeon]